jgi:hypothetical protein
MKNLNFDNKRNLSIVSSGFGHWRIECDYRRKRIHTVTHNSIDVDNFRSQSITRIKQGYKNLIQQIINDNKK